MAQTVGSFVQDSLMVVESGTLGGAHSFGAEAVSILNSQTFDLPGTEAKAGCSCDEDSNVNARRKRDLTPSERKDDSYWDKRKKNNEAAKRSREKRRANDLVLERRVLGLLEENAHLKAELLAVRFRFGLIKDPSDVSILSLSASSCTHPRSYQTDGPSCSSSSSSRQVHPQPLKPSAGSLSTHCVPPESNISPTGCSKVGNTSCKDECCRSSQPHLACEEVTESQHTNRQDSPEGLKNLPHKLRFKSPPGGELPPSPDSRLGGRPAEPNVQVKNQQLVGWDGPAETRTPYSREEARGGFRQQNQSSPFDPFPQNSNYECSTDEVSLRSQISCLSQEVAQLKKLLSQQLPSKMV
ncbi:NFIL3 like protein [Nothobranchius furzeri]|uniref:Nuclear factor interleukin-3-regulated protein-like n=3 Tax=Nothobranchius furzeri TaxID=105023 RepID=A0A8C6L1Y7_NOTFU|nr:nuclear factor interleukin-3-regulated protein-like [Nothobranchius furzeri]